MILEVVILGLVVFIIGPLIIVSGGQESRCGHLHRLSKAILEHFLDLHRTPSDPKSSYDQARDRQTAQVCC